MEEKQKTISSQASFSGVGLHSGEPCEVFFKPAPANTGIYFLKNGSPVGTLGRDHSLFLLDPAARCSAIGAGASRILTVEHVLAAIYGLGISNLAVDVHGGEVPAADGSARPFVELFKKIGIREQKEKRYVYSVGETVLCSEGGKTISIHPSKHFEISYELDYDFPYLRDQRAGFVISPATFEKEIAPARTFCTSEEALELKRRGLGLGGSRQNNIVVSADGEHQKDLRFPDEFARHKILDMIGDLSLLGFPVLGRVTGVRSGHALNRRLVQAIRAQKESHGK